MQIVQKYPIKIEQWIHLSVENFIGVLSDNECYIFGITPEDPNYKECIYFNVWFEKKIINESNKTIVFFAKTYNAFKVKNDFKKPTSQFYFDLVNIASYEFAQLFYKKVQNTNIAHHKIQKPSFPELKADLEKTIDIWDKNFRNRVFVPIPNWQNRFKDLPEIPNDKKWIEGSYYTYEQDISFKLLNRQQLTEEDVKRFKNLTYFYEELDKKLIKLDYESFSNKDFDDFVNYIFYAFNYVALHSNDLTVYKTYRLVVNEKVTGKNESITKIDSLKYPPLDKVKEFNIYNRANTPKTTVFYSAENIDTAIKEIRPPLNKLVSVGFWRPKDINKKLISYPISHSESALHINESVQKSTRAFEELSKYDSTLLIDFLRYYFKLLGREYTKRISHHYEYLISALFSERIFESHLEINDKKDFKYDCIIYPSVGNDYTTENLAIYPDTLDNDFFLEDVIQFEIEEAYYDKKCELIHPELITLAKIKNFRKAIDINDKGEIQW